MVSWSLSASGDGFRRPISASAVQAVTDRLASSNSDTETHTHTYKFLSGCEEVNKMLSYRRETALQGALQF